MVGLLIKKNFTDDLRFDMNRGIVVSRDVTADRPVINPFGQKSSMRAVSKYQERLITP